MGWGRVRKQTSRPGQGQEEKHSMDSFSKATQFPDLKAVYRLPGSIPKIRSVSYVIMLFLAEVRYVSINVGK